MWKEHVWQRERVWDDLQTYDLVECVIFSTEVDNLAESSDLQIFLLIPINFY